MFLIPLFNFQILLLPPFMNPMFFLSFFLVEVGAVGLLVFWGGRLYWIFKNYILCVTCLILFSFS